MCAEIVPVKAQEEACLAAEAIEAEVEGRVALGAQPSLLLSSASQPLNRALLPALETEEISATRRPGPDELTLPISLPTVPKTGS